VASRNGATRDKTSDDSGSKIPAKKEVEAARIAPAIEILQVIATKLFMEIKVAVGRNYVGTRSRFVKW
jgi:hypothetical protein